MIWVAFRHEYTNSWSLSTSLPAHWPVLVVPRSALCAVSYERNLSLFDCWCLPECASNRIICSLAWPHSKQGCSGLGPIQCVCLVLVSSLSWSNWHSLLACAILLFVSAAHFTLALFFETFQCRACDKQQIRVSLMNLFPYPGRWSRGIICVAN